MRRKRRITLILLFGWALTLLGPGCEESPPPNGKNRQKAAADSQQAAPPAADPEQTAPTSTAEGSLPDPATVNPLGLPEPYRRLLRQEMARLQGAMSELHARMVRGQLDQAAGVAQRIHNSFILKQELSQKQLQELQKMLPAPFIEKDRAFHRDAAQLAEALRKRRVERVGELYGRMAASCIECHRQHATERFPGLSPKD